MEDLFRRSIASLLLLSVGTIGFFPSIVLAEQYNQPITDDGTIQTNEILPSTNHSKKVSRNEVKESLENVPGLLAESDDAKVTRDKDSAAILQTEGIEIDIPKKASDGVAMDIGEDISLEINLPNADRAKKGKTVAQGVIAYPGKDGFANAVQADEDGGVRMLTIIDNPDAPLTYEYAVDLPDGSIIELDDDGGAMIIDSDENVVAIVETPWAQDATGTIVNTWFSTNGTTLIQHVLHNQEGVVYPVVADPAWFAALLPIFIWAAGACAGEITSEFSEDVLYWALKKKNWYWKQQVNEAIGDCAWGMIWGGVLGKFLPERVKKKIKKRAEDAKFYKRLKKKIRKVIKKNL